MIDDNKNERNEVIVESAVTAEAAVTPTSALLVTATDPLGHFTNSQLEEEDEIMNGNKLHHTNNEAIEFGHEKPQGLEDNGGNTPSVIVLVETTSEKATSTNFGDFDFGATPPMNSDPENGGDFGDFNEVSSSPKQETQANSPTDVGVFDSAMEGLETSPALLDEFQEFASTDPVEETLFDNAVAAESADGTKTINFGELDFGATPSMDSDPKNGDDYGDFNEVVSSQQQETETLDAYLSSHEGVKDFGSFNEATSQEHLTDTEQEVGPPTGTSIRPVESTIVVEDGSFGDLTEISKVTMSKTSEEADDDEFGDFSDFTDNPTGIITPMNTISNDFSAPLSAADDCFCCEGNDPTSSKKTFASNEEDDGDDFGDFNDVPVEQEQPTAKLNSLDDFGDFNGTKIALPTTVSTVGTIVDPGTTQGADDDDFGDFGEFDEDPNGFEALQDALVPIPEDPIVTKARTVFAHVFNTFNGHVDDGNDEESSPSTVLVKDILEQALLSRGPVDSPSWSTGALDAVLNDVDILGTAAPRVVIDDTAVPPYAHFSMPPGGVNRSDYFLQKRRPAEKRLLVPSVAAIQLPTGRKDAYRNEVARDERPSDHNIPTPTAASSSQGSSSPQQNGLSPVKLDLSDLKTPEGNERGGTAEMSHPSMISDVAKQFLLQIPDLSFMLSSTVCMRKK